MPWDMPPANADTAAAALEKDKNTTKIEYHQKKGTSSTDAYNELKAKYKIREAPLEGEMMASAGDETEKPASFMTKEQENHGWAMVNSDKLGGVDSETTIRTLKKEGYTDAQIQKLLGTTVVLGQEKPDTASAGGGFAEVQ